MPQRYDPRRMLLKRDIALIFRLVLGREPEGAATLNNLVALGSVDAAFAALCESAEHNARHYGGFEARAAEGWLAREFAGGASDALTPTIDRHYRLATLDALHRALTGAEIAPDYLDFLLTLPSLIDAAREMRATLSREPWWRARWGGGDIGQATTQGGPRDTGWWDALLRDSAWDFAAMHALQLALGLPVENPYYVAHAARFWECFVWLRARDAERKIGSLLEIGCNRFTSHVWRSLLPDARLATIDRPIATGGEPEGWAFDGGIDRHLNHDLDRGPIAPVLNERFDIIICTEVVEHLLLDPDELIADLGACLTPEGRLFLTTPNFLSIDAVEALAWGYNPAAIMRRDRGNVDAHHHFREYTMRELEDAVARAGLTVTRAAYSACWDDADKLARSDGNPCLRRNLVLEIARPQAAPEI